MSEFIIHTKESAPESSQEALAGLERNVGFIPNLAATIAESPVAMQGFVAMQSALRQSALSPVEREVVGIAVSVENSAPYSVAAHSTFARAQGAPQEVIDALCAGGELPDSRLEAVAAFARELVRSRGRSAGEVAALLEAGYSREQVLEIIAQTAYTTMANLVANVAGTPIDEAFQPAAVQT